MQALARALAVTVGLLAATAARAQTETTWNALEPTPRPIGPSPVPPVKPAYPFFKGVIPVAGSTEFLNDPAAYPVVYAFQGAPAQSVEGQNTTLSYRRQDMALIVPLKFLSEAKDQGIFLSLAGRIVKYDTDAILPTTMQPFPKDLYDIRPSLLVRKVFDNGWIMGLSAGLASPSDKPYENWNVVLPTVVGYLNFPKANGDAWVASLTYMPSSNINFPIPGIAYQWNYSPDFEMSIGAPLEIRWRFLEDCYLEMGYLPVRQFRGQAAWKPIEGLTFFTGFEWLNDSYLLSDRTSNREFFYQVEKRLYGGFRWQLLKHLTFDATAGYAFDRSFFSGVNYTDQTNQVYVGSGAYGMVRLGVNF